MNKELILKYKTEFDHWLNGGKLQAKFVNDPWEEAPEDIFSYNTVNFVLVIDDSYSIYRKALAEGNTIQYYECIYQHEMDVNLDRYDWLDWKSATPSSSFTKTLKYRIKPEEPKFKVGDWVRVKTGTFEYDGTARISKGVKQLSKSDMWLFSENHYKCNPDNYIEHWQPKEGEWCWVGYKLMKFNKIIKEDYSTTFEFIFPGRDADGYKIKEYILETHLQIVEPFIGQLPTKF